MYFHPNSSKKTLKMNLKYHLEWEALVQPASLPIALHGSLKKSRSKKFGVGRSGEPTWITSMETIPASKTIKTKQMKGLKRTEEKKKLPNSYLPVCPILQHVRQHLNKGHKHQKKYSPKYHARVNFHFCFRRYFKFILRVFFELLGWK